MVPWFAAGLFCCLGALNSPLAVTEMSLPSVGVLALSRGFCRSIAVYSTLSVLDFTSKEAAFIGGPFLGTEGTAYGGKS